MSDKPYWLVSAPKTREPLVEKQNQKLKDVAVSYNFNTPEFRVGTLDQLMTLSDELTKIDLFVETVVKKIGRQFRDVMEDKDTKDLFSINGATIDNYLRNFPWDDAKYSAKKSLKELVDIIATKISKMDEDLKTLSSEYNQLNQSIAATKRQDAGNLMVRGLAELVKQEHIIQSEYLTTLIVVVSKNFYKDWLTSYEQLTDLVVPRSSKVITEDMDFMLVTVTLFKKTADDFKAKAREKRFTVRDFSFNPEGATNEASQKKKLEEDRFALQRKLTMWCKTNFAESFTSWIHLKAIRVYVESVLRFGLPVNFQVLLTVVSYLGYCFLYSSIFILFCAASKEG
eukprot:TRINITY_DN1109_c0_g1_i1.p1 TRINITY_DN1109_c0_g1~~TRINITY_DN1109_c0_g1_i1.p1  ORF type:complete len:341 (-),score=67.82 TRINITY_DN1109_c0_g1_i1:302-1324(-)